MYVFLIKPASSICYFFGFQASMLLETMCLAFFIYRFLHSAYFSQREVFFRDTKNWLILVVIVVRGPIYDHYEKQMNIQHCKNYENIFLKIELN